MDKKLMQKSLMGASLVLVAALIVGTVPTFLSSAKAESAGTAVANDLDDAATTVKKKSRKAKKKVRDTMGTGSIKKDVKDAARDAEDEAHNSKRKVERKAD